MTPDPTMLPAAPTTTTALSAGSLFTRVQTMDDAARLCKALAASKMTPPAFRNDHGAILMALNVSQAVGCDLFMVMQNMYDVHGRMGFSGQYCIAALNRSPKYRRIEYRYCNGQDWQAGIQVIGHRADGDTPDIGTAITPAMVKAEGWDKNTKWRTMPEQMYKYRAAAFFTRAYCPDLLMGFQTVEELRDLYANGTFKPEPTPRTTQARVITPDPASLPVDTTPAAEQGRADHYTETLFPEAEDEIPGLNPAPAYHD